jgi:hypothetical protein
MQDQLLRVQKELEKTKLRVERRDDMVKELRSKLKERAPDGSQTESAMTESDRQVNIERLQLKNDEYKRVITELRM